MFLNNFFFLGFLQGGSFSIFTFFTLYSGNPFLCAALWHFLQSKIRLFVLLSFQFSLMWCTSKSLIPVMPHSWQVILSLAFIVCSRSKPICRFLFGVLHLACILLLLLSEQNLPPHTLQVTMYGLSISSFYQKTVAKLVRKATVYWSQVYNLLSIALST